jgi:hypothetical protein
LKAAFHFEIIATTLYNFLILTFAAYIYFAVFFTINIFVTTVQFRQNKLTKRLYTGLLGIFIFGLLFSLINIFS